MSMTNTISVNSLVTATLNEKNIKKLNKTEINNDILSEVSSETCSKSIDLSMNNYCRICDPKCKYLDCICADSWKSFDETFENIKSVSSKILLESLRISTITLCFDLSTNVDTEQLSQKYYSKNNGKFYNSLIFNWHTKYQIKTVVSVKIFPNGKVQVAGLSNIKSCAYIIRKVCNKCKDFYENKDSIKDLPKVSNVKIAMINSDFKITNSINLTSFCDYYQIIQSNQMVILLVLYTTY